MFLNKIKININNDFFHIFYILVIKSWNRIIGDLRSLMKLESIKEVLPTSTFANNKLYGWNEAASVYKFDFSTNFSHRNVPMNSTYAYTQWFPMLLYQSNYTTDLQLDRNWLPASEVSSHHIHPIFKNISTNFMRLVKPYWNLSI